MKKLSIVSATLLLTASGLGGCGAPSTETDNLDEAAGLEEAAESDGPRTLAEVDVGYGTVIFQEVQELDGTVSISVAEITPNDYGSSPFHDIASRGGHTSLELFRAVAPTQEVPQALVDAHEHESQSLGRDPSEVIVPEFDRDAPIEKITQACRTYVTPMYGQCYYYTPVNEKDANWADSLNLGSSSYYTTGPLYLGLCNESSQHIVAKVKRRAENASPYVGLSTYAQQTVPPGSKFTQYTAFHLDPFYRHQVTGTPLIPYMSASYSLRAGKLQRNSTLCPNAPFPF